MSGKPPFIIGLTGSIGMGKSTAAKMFAAYGIPVWDADRAVERIYSRGGAGVGPIGDICPDAVKDNAVDKQELRRWIEQEEDALQKIEDIVHPFVARDRATFLQATKADIIVLDIPLLFETGLETDVDMTVVVSVPLETQTERVLSRPGMTRAQFDLILSKQMPDAEKRLRADIVIPGETLDETNEAVQNIIRRIRERQKNA